MNVVDILKPVGGIVGSLCASQVVETIIGTFKPGDLTKVGKAAWIIGGTLIGGAVGSAAGDYLCETIDTVKEAIDTMKGKKETTV